MLPRTLLLGAAFGAAALLLRRAAAGAPREDARAWRALSVAATALALLCATGAPLSGARPPRADDFDRRAASIAFTSNGLPQAHLRLALFFAREGRLEPALEHGRRALALAPEFPAMHGNMALFLDQAGRLEEGERHHREALRLAPGSAGVWHNWGAALQARGRRAEARAAFRRALELDPRLEPSRARLRALGERP